jgi:hypothetical protein
MIRSTRTAIVSLLVALALLLPGFTKPAEAARKSKKKVGCVTKMVRTVKRKVKKAAKKVRRAVVKTSCKITNKVMDAGVKAKAKITGKKPKKTYVCGHYKKGNKRHTKGHFRRIKKTKRAGSSSSGSFNAPAPAPSAPPAVTTGDPLPPVDPVLPVKMNRTRKSKR